MKIRILICTVLMVFSVLSYGANDSEPKDEIKEIILTQNKKVNKDKRSLPEFISASLYSIDNSVRVFCPQSEGNTQIFVYNSLMNVVGYSEFDAYEFPYETIFLPKITGLCYIIIITENSYAEGSFQIN